MKRKLNKLIAKCKNVVPVLSGAFFMAAVSTSMVLAADTSSVTKPLENIGNCDYWCNRSNHSCKECHGVCASLSAAGFVNDELCFKGNCGRRYDGRYFIGTCNLRILKKWAYA